MANVNMFRGGTPDFKPVFCAGDYSQYQPPFSSPHLEDTPPYNSHACAAYGQGWLNLQFPLIPNLQQNDAHKWQREALKNVKAVGDVIRLAWVPLRAYIQAQHFELVRGDEMLGASKDSAGKTLAGVYVMPYAERCSWNIATEQYDWKEETAYTAAITAAGITQFPLGLPVDGDSVWGFAKLDDVVIPTQADADDEDATPGFTVMPAPCTFGHNLLKYDANGNPTGGLDEFYGGVVLGLKITAGDPSKIANIWRGDFALYMSAKLSAFEAATQIA